MSKRKKRDSRRYSNLKMFLRDKLKISLSIKGIQRDRFKGNLSS